jgi:hypothetical protein
MKPQTIGRVLGIGVRLVGRMAGQRIIGPDSAGTVSRPVTIEGVAGSGAGRVSGRTAGRASGSLARGVGGFFKPFRRVGNIVFLEVVGLFFFVFVLVFSQTVWRARASYLHGPDHRKFLVAGALVLVFLYLGASSFWRARRR